ncbi:glycosyltransferase family 4 protein [Candidatus Peribacteria bacterium]|jgi:glycosyltransferase involved in cell wall biosynthesis|nr:glycosyltransferase family 4 protein [Candidatus Peribacteria bacterium]MBT4021180.1 glycosyltransferase family 4 protein [Candidatus Peribacteria bacterium]MBT4240956.1 glycosyltransferase family 4 protein [Candidatus Peribacteria bacterium]MBT4474599.1 glycosyltransferase family 4 protein [Candidatus Peribacteria bacterium]
MKVLIICEDTNGMDGWSKYSKLLEDGLIKNGHTVQVCQTGLLLRPIKYLSNPLNAIISAIKIKNIIKDFNPDIIHITVEPFAMIFAFLNRKILQKTILTIHGTYGIKPIKNWISRPFAKIYYKRIRSFICVSNYTKQKVAEAIKKYAGESLSKRFESNVIVIKNGIKIRPTYSDAKHDRNILLVGGVKYRKGVIQAIEACYQYKEIYKKPFHLFVVGQINNSKYVADAKIKIIELGLSNEVTLTGKASEKELENYYEKSNLFLMPSLTKDDNFEGFGIVYLEANAYGIPCIGPNNSGAMEAINNNYSGYHTDPHDPKHIAECIHKILDLNTIETINCREWAEKHRIENSIKEIEDLYVHVKNLAI